MRNIVFIFMLFLIASTFPYSVSADDKYESVSATVKMQERNLKVTVYYYKGDEQWAKHVLDLSLETLPIIEQLAGFPYSHEFDVTIYGEFNEKRCNVIGCNLGEKGIWIVPSSDDMTIIHEITHFWTFNRRKWMAEGFAEFYTYLIFLKLNRIADVEEVKKNRFYNFIDRISKYDWYLDKDFYELPIPKDITDEEVKKRGFCYSKSFIFSFMIYRKFGLDTIQDVNRYFSKNQIRPDSKGFLSAMETIVGEDLDDFFSGWIFEGEYKVFFPNDVNDSDDDGLIDFEEKCLKTNIRNPDTDGDRLSDYDEIEFNTNPLKKDTDGDGLEDGFDSGIIIDGRIDDWQRYAIYPLIVDPQGDTEKGKINSDIKRIYALMDNRYLIVAFEMYEKADPFAGHYINIDINGDQEWEYEIGITRDSYFLNDLKNPKIPKPKNIIKHSVDEIAEMKIPLIIIRNPRKITLQAFTFIWTGPDNFKKDRTYNNMISAMSLISTNPLIPDTDKDGFRDGDDMHPIVRENEWKNKAGNIALSIFNQGQIEFNNTNYDNARYCFEEAFTIYTQIGDESGVKATKDSISKCDQQTMIVQTVTTTPISQSQEQKKTGIPIFSIISAILLIYLGRKIRK